MEGSVVTWLVCSDTSAHPSPFIGGYIVVPEVVIDSICVDIATSEEFEVITTPFPACTAFVPGFREVGGVWKALVSHRTGVVIEVCAAHPGPIVVGDLISP